jgi:hypothetical protein
MKLYKLSILLLVSLSLISCKEEMQIDPYLLAHSKKFSIKTEGEGWYSTVRMGHFSSYEKQSGTLWMQEAGLMQYFDENQLITFATDNNDNYSYDHILYEVTDVEIIRSYALDFNMPLEVPEHFEKAFIGYLYASHDEYAMACVKVDENNFSGFLTNGFDTYEIMPVLSAETPEQLMGYQVKLYDEFVGAVQVKNQWSFRMTSEYCDATELILASIASMLVKCETLKS